MEVPLQGGQGTEVRRKPSVAERVRLWLMDQGTAVLVIVLLLLGWELAVRLLKVPQFILPTPS
ncbi:MAG TPA: hypothetical protein VGL40_02235, partial [Bacillota bacterium]